MKISKILKNGLALTLALSSFGITNAATEVYGPYYWNIIPILDSNGTQGTETTIKVQLTDEDDGFYVSEVGNTNYFNGTKLQVTLKTFSGTSTFAKQTVTSGTTQYIAQCFSISTGVPVALSSASFSFSYESGFSPKANQGFGWYETSDGTTAGNWYSGFIYSSRGEAPEDGDDDDNSQLTGTYTWTIQPVTNIYGTKSGETVNIQVSVSAGEGSSSAGTESYVLSEVGNTNYFLGQTLPITYYTDAKMAQIEPITVTIGTQKLYFACFLYEKSSNMIMPQTLMFTLTNSGEFKPSSDNAGIAFYTTVNNGGETPEGFYSGFFYGTDAEGGTEPTPDDSGIAYPKYATIQGTHTFTGTFTWENGYEQYASEFANSLTFYEEGEFTLESDQSLSGFIGAPTNNPYLTYSTNNGTIKLKNVGIGTYFGEINGNYGGYSFGLANAAGEWDGATNPTFVWQVVDEEGHIVIPDFTVVIYSGNTATVVGRYTRCKVDGFTLLPELTVSDQNVAVTGDDVEITVNVAMEKYEAAEVAKWRANLTNGNDAEDLEAEGVYDNGVVTFILTDIAPGDYTYTLEVLAEDEAGEIIAIGNEVEIEFSIAAPATLEISEPVVTEDEGNATVTLAASTLSINPEDIAKVVANLTNDTTSEEIEAVYSDGTITFVIEDLEPGTYSYTVTVSFFNLDEELIVTSNEILVSIDITTTGINGIGSNNSNARYYNLNGIETKNPAKGGVYIKIENGKISKEIKR